MKALRRHFARWWWAWLAAALFVFCGVVAATSGWWADHPMPTELP